MNKGGGGGVLYFGGRFVLVLGRFGIFLGFLGGLRGLKKMLKVAGVQVLGFFFLNLRDF